MKSSGPITALFSQSETDHYFDIGIIKLSEIEKSFIVGKKNHETKD